MTTEKAKEFWAEWKALRAKWEMRVYASTDETVEAEFPDGASIQIDRYTSLPAGIGFVIRRNAGRECEEVAGEP